MRTAGDEERRQRIKANGLECLGRLHGDQTWEDWMGVAAAMEIITEEALAASGSFKWDANDRRAVKEFNMRWDEYEAGAGRNYKPLSKQERWAVREVTSNPEISAYRAGLTGPEKRRLNHPNAVINRWKAREKAKATPAGGQAAIRVREDEADQGRAAGGAAQGQEEQRRQHAHQGHHAKRRCHYHHRLL